jgi:hypothetical protein
MDNIVATPAPRTVRFGEVRKVLISTGFGSGWSSQAYDADTRSSMLYDADIIAYLEAGNELYVGHPLLQKYEDADVYISPRSLQGLVVTKATTPFRVTEYDGSEGIEEFNPTRWEF